VLKIPDKIGGAVDRVDDKAKAHGYFYLTAALFSKKSAAGERGGQAAYPLGERTPDGLMLFSRTAGGNEVTVAANLSAEEVAFDLPFEGSRREFFTGKEYTGGTRTVLPAWQWLVFAQDRR